MGRSPCCDKSGLKKGPWTPEEDSKLTQYINAHGAGNWRLLPKNAGLQRCPKSCRLRWINYLRPDIKRGRFSFEEEETIIKLHSVLGNKWSAIAARLPGRTDNEIKNFWNTHIRKRLLRSGIDPVTHAPRLDLLDLSSLLSSPQLSLHNLRLQTLLNPEALSLAMSLLSSSQLAPPTFQPNQFENIINQQIPPNLNINSFQNQSQSLRLDNAVDNQQNISRDLRSSWSDQIRDLDENSSFDQSMSISSNNNSQNFSLDSTPLSSPFTSAINGSMEDERESLYSNMFRFEIPEGLDFDDLM